MNIVLIGYRGSGKTTVGRKLASQLWKTYVDTDAEVCKRLGGRTIADIWKTEGEAEFRRVECEVVEQVMRRPDQVIGLGGGTLMQERARAAVRAAADTVRIYLKCDPQTLHQRITADAQTAATRPNLTALGGGVQEITQMLAQREPVYLATADKTLDVSLLAPDDAVRHLIERCL
jgi:shikimate kinase